MVEKKESFDEKCMRLGLFDKSLEDIIDMIAEKDKEIERLEAENDNMRKIFDGLMAILPPEYFVKEDSDG